MPSNLCIWIKIILLLRKMLILDGCPQRNISKKYIISIRTLKVFLLAVFDSKCYLYSSFLIKKLQRIFIQNNDICLNRMLIIFHFKIIAKVKLICLLLVLNFRKKTNNKETPEKKSACCCHCKYNVRANTVWFL